MKLLPKHKEPLALPATTESRNKDVIYSVDTLFAQLKPETELNERLFLQLVESLSTNGYKVAIVTPKSKQHAAVVVRTTVKRELWINPRLYQKPNTEQEKVLQILQALPYEGYGKLRKQLWQEYNKLGA